MVLSKSKILLFRKKTKECQLGSHSPKVTCKGPDTVMIDKISIVSGASLGYKSAIEYCREQLDGQFWGDIDDFPEALQVF